MQRLVHIRLTLPCAGIKAQIEKATYVGSHMEYIVSGDFGQVFAILDDVDDPLAPGDPVMLSFDEKGPVLLPTQ